MNFLSYQRNKETQNSLFTLFETANSKKQNLLFNDIDFICKNKLYSLHYITTIAKKKLK